MLKKKTKYKIAMKQMSKGVPILFVLSKRIVNQVQLIILKVLISAGTIIFRYFYFYHRIRLCFN